MVVVSGVYLVAGVTFAALAARAPTDSVRVAWRMAAWLTGAAAFAGHLVYEQMRLRNSPRTTAWHASLAVAAGAFAYAVAANVHALWATASPHRFLASALVVWPVVSAAPAFVIALAVATGLARWRPST